MLIFISFQGRYLMKQEYTKQKILKCALRLFSEHGYESVRVEQIANAVGIKAPSLYNHFKSKQAIFDAILEESAEHYDNFAVSLSLHMENAKKDAPSFENISVESLAATVKKIFLYSLHDETVSQTRKMMTIEQFRSPELAAAYTRRYVERLVSYHAQIFRPLMESGEIAAENPDSLALLYVAPVITLIGICDREPQMESACLEMLDAHIKLFWSTFGGGRR